MTSKLTQKLYIGHGREAQLEWPSDISPDEVRTMFEGLEAFHAFLSLQAFAAASEEKGKAPQKALPPAAPRSSPGNRYRGDATSASELRSMILEKVRKDMPRRTFGAIDLHSLCSDKIRVKNGIAALLRSGDFVAVGRGEYRLATCPTTNAQT